MKKHPKTATITLNDLSRALKKRWSIKTCILAQTAIRTGLITRGASDVGQIVDNSQKAEVAMNLFDDAYGLRRDQFPPNRKLIAKLKAMLPIKVKL